MFVGLGVTEFAVILIILIILIPIIFYLLTLQKALLKCAEKNRAMSPGMVWLQLIPLFNMVWHFFIVLNVAKSLNKEFEERGIKIDPMPGKSIGLAMCILGVMSVIPYIGVLFGLAGFVCWIIYWVKISDYSSKIGGQNKIGVKTKAKISVAMKFESFSEAVDMLVAIYDKTPRGEGFLTTDSSEQARLVRQIGDILNGMGGMDEMLEAHAQFKMLRPRAARNLEMMWDGIGGWRG